MCAFACCPQVGSDYIEKKSLERYGEEHQAPDNAPPTVGGWVGGGCRGLHVHSHCTKTCCGME